MKHFKDFTDDVGGVIIGDVMFSGQLYYEGRPQRGRFYARDDVELGRIAKSLKAQILEDCGPAAYLIYPDVDAWTMKIQ